MEHLNFLRYDVLAVLKTAMSVFWFVKPYGLEGRYQRFGESYCFHLQGRDSMIVRNVGMYLQVRTAAQLILVTSICATVVW